jgi:putative ABC transport system permease protein
MIRNYLLVAWKVLMRRKFFTFISLFGICFTLTILLIVTALLDASISPQEPETKSDRTLLLHTVTMKSPDGNSSQSSAAGYGLINKYVRTLPDVEKVALYSQPFSMTAYHNGEKITLHIKQTDVAFWEILTFNFLEGRSFTVQEEENAALVAVINAAMRDRLFGGAPAVGKYIRAEGKTFRVIGVVENIPIFRTVPYADMWIPISTLQTAGYREALMGNLTAVVLARDTKDFSRIKSDFQNQLRQVVFPDPKHLNSITTSLDTYLQFFTREYMQGETREVQFFSILILFALLFMLLPAINLININISRIMERASEIGVRKAFGASSRMLVGQFVIENLVLVLLGGIASLFCAYIVLALLGSSGILLYAEFHLNIRIFCYALAASVVFALLSGVYPAWRMSQLHPAEALKGGRA